MSQPLYFLPNCQLPQLQNVLTSRQLLKERGLAEIFRDVSQETMMANEPSGHGPGDQPGCIVLYPRPDGGIPNRLDYRKDEQKWTPVGDGKLLWIGIDPQSPPTAADLVRPVIHKGYELKLLDSGDPWEIPIIRRPDGTSELPSDMYVDEKGTLQEPVKRGYLHHWERSEETASWFYGKVVPDKRRGLHLAIEALGINYRYGATEHPFVRAIDKQNWLSILAATVDYYNTRAQSEAQKKTDSSFQK